MDVNPSRLLVVASVGPKLVVPAIVVVVDDVVEAVVRELAAVGLLVMRDEVVVNGRFASIDTNFDVDVDFTNL